MEVSDAVVGISNFRGAAPTSDTSVVAWSTLYDNDIGNAIVNGVSNDPNLLLGGAGVSYRLNSVEFATFDAIDFVSSNVDGNDDIELDPDGTIAYPTLVPGDFLSWLGAGTLTLSKNVEGFLIPGTYSSPIAGGNYVVNISIAAVPEPTAFPFGRFVAGSVGMVVARRRPARKPLADAA
ncbi:hypothetical protein [Posidoniimonas polymericola]|uniref:hypothetical protein n=1 Tax=Posidoniimonas polymericola TaxID=2528002 RepID=UPI0011B38C72|nr:hypothetical protein [Posidoniimonas polymericola]